MQKRTIIVSIFAACTCLAAQPNRIHSICDISTDFTFYMDGRFYKQYIAPDGADARNWGTLWKLDLTDANLLVLSSGESLIDYDPRSILHVKKFVTSGGAVLILASNAGFRPDQCPVDQAMASECRPREARGPFETAKRSMGRA